MYELSVSPPSQPNLPLDTTPLSNATDTLIVQKAKIQNALNTKLAEAIRPTHMLGEHIRNIANTFANDVADKKDKFKGQIYKTMYSRLGEVQTMAKIAGANPMSLEDMLNSTPKGNILPFPPRPTAEPTTSGSGSVGDPCFICWENATGPCLGGTLANVNGNLCCSAKTDTGYVCLPNYYLSQSDCIVACGGGPPPPPPVGSTCWACVNNNGTQTCEAGTTVHTEFGIACQGSGWTAPPGSYFPDQATCQAHCSAPPPPPPPGKIPCYYAVCLGTKVVCCPSEVGPDGNCPIGACGDPFVCPDGTLINNPIGGPFPSDTSCEDWINANYPTGQCCVGGKPPPNICPPCPPNICPPNICPPCPPCPPPGGTSTCCPTNVTNTNTCPPANINVSCGSGGPPPPPPPTTTESCVINNNFPSDITLHVDLTDAIRALCECLAQLLCLKCPETVDNETDNPLIDPNVFDDTYLPPETNT